MRGANHRQCIDWLLGTAGRPRRHLVARARSRPCARFRRTRRKAPHSDPLRRARCGGRDLRGRGCPRSGRRESPRHAQRVAAALLAETSLERVSESNPSILVIATLTGGRSEERKSEERRNEGRGTCFSSPGVLARSGLRLIGGAGWIARRGCRVLRNGRRARRRRRGGHCAFGIEQVIVIRPEAQLDERAGVGHLLVLPAAVGLVAPHCLFGRWIPLAARIAVQIMLTNQSFLDLPRAGRVDLLLAAAPTLAGPFPFVRCALG